MKRRTEQEATPLELDAWHRATEQRFIPYDCGACFECFHHRSCIYSYGPQTPEEIEAAQEKQDQLWRDIEAMWNEPEQLELELGD